MVWNTITSALLLADTAMVIASEIAISCCLISFFKHYSSGQL